MKFKITSGKDTAEVTIDPDQGPIFTGTIQFPGHPAALILAGQRVGDELSADVSAEGQKAHFNATLHGTAIVGRLTVPWPLDIVFPSRDFAGVRIV